MSVDFLPFLIFVTVATFTPGPGNITSAGMGMMFGYRRTLRFLMGIVLGYLSVMLLCAFVSGEVLHAIPAAEPVLRIVGSAYLLFLTYGVARANYEFDSEERQPMSFVHGFCLQALNPKAIIFGLTIYTTFLSPLAHQPYWLLASVVFLTCLTYGSVSVWALSGTWLRRFLHIPKIRIAVNSLLVILLMYCAASISGVLS